MVVFINNIYFSFIEASIIILFLCSELEIKHRKCSRQTIFVIGMIGMLFAEMLFKTGLFFGFMAVAFLILIIFLRLFLKGDVLKQEAMLFCVELILLVIRIASIGLANRIMGDYHRGYVLSTYVPYYFGSLLCVITFGNLFLCHKENRTNVKQKILLNLIVFVQLAVALAVMFACSSANTADKSQSFMGVMLLGSSLGCGIAVIGIYAEIKSNTYMVQNVLLRQKLVAAQTNVIKIEEDYQNARKIRHDMRRNVAIYTGLLKEKRYDELESEWKRQIEDFPKDNFVYIKGNNKISAVLNEKMNLCKYRQIEMLLKNTAVIDETREMDMAIVLSNLIDNAVEAQNGVNYKIAVDIFESNGMYNILVKNALYSSAAAGGYDTSPIERDERWHGLGLSIVNDIIERYEGFTDYEIKSNQFAVHVAVPI